MSTVNHLHGDPAVYGQFLVLAEPDPRGKLEDQYPEEGEVIIRRIRKFPEYAGNFWLLAAKGKSRSPLSADRAGNVSVNCKTFKIYEGTNGVKPSQLNKGELDIAAFLQDKLALGWVRVDHLEDADGVKFGCPDPATNRGRESFREYSWGLLDPHRLKQLATEMNTSEPGRKILDSWAPAVPLSVERRLLSPKGKLDVDVKRDRVTLASARARLAEAALAVREALNPPEEVKSAPVEFVAAVPPKATPAPTSFRYDPSPAPEGASAVTVTTVPSIKMGEGGRVSRHIEPTLPEHVDAHAEALKSLAEKGAAQKARQDAVEAVTEPEMVVGPNFDAEYLGTLSAPELRDLCKANGLNTARDKQTMIDRLLAPGA